MNVSVERPQPCQAVLTIEVDEAMFDQAKDRAYREYARYLTVPGFRPGKAPRHLIEQMVDAETIAQRAREIVIPMAYKAAIDQEGLDIYDVGSVDNVSEDESKPPSFTATVPLRPEITLGNLEGLKARRYVPPVTDQDIQNEIDRVLQSSARLEPTTEPAQDGDVAFADMDTSVGGESLGDTRSATFTVGQNMPEIDAILRGASSGDTKETDVDYPADYADENLAGKTVHFTLRINHILHKAVPELTDAWVSENTVADNIEALREMIRKDLDANAKRLAETDVRNQLLTQVVERSEVHFPTQIVDREVAEDLKELKANVESRRLTLDQYLRSIGKTLQELQDEMAISATSRVKNGLVMGRIAQDAQLEVTKEDMNAEVDRLAALNEMKPRDMRRRLKDEGELDRLEDRLLQEKFFDYLKSNAEITEEGSAPESE